MEEITTIFVVGFPDDMNEREFQNMFIFNPGFEAATLKIPTPNKDGRKQIIGFAKFHTKMDALNAMEVLTGRQIDFEKGSILKAEMAKKNLHTKKTMMNMYYPTSSMKNSCMQYHNMMPDNVNNYMNFNNNNMANNLCNQLLKDDNNVYQLNNLNRGMNLPTNAGMGQLANNGLMLPGARERTSSMNLLNTATQPFMDQNSSLFNGNRNMYKLPNYQNLDMNHSTAMNATKPGFDKLYKNIPGTTNGASNQANNNNNNSLLYNNNLFNFLADNPNAPKALKQQQSLPNNIFSFNNTIQKPMQQPNTFSSNPSSFMNNVYRQPSSLLDNDFSVNNNHTTGTSAVGAATGNSKFNQTGSLNSLDSPFSNDLYNNGFNLPLNYFGGNTDLLKRGTSLHENGKEGLPMDDLKKVSPLSTSSTTPLFFSPINKTPGFMDLNNNGSTIDNLNGKSGMMDPTGDLNSKFYNLSLNMAMDKSTTKSDKDSENFDGVSKDDQSKTEKSKDDLEFSNTNDFINGTGANSILKNNFTFNLFSNENSSSILDSLGKNDSYGLISKLSSSSSMNLPYKKGHFDKINSLNDKDVELSLQSNEESSSTISSNNTITNAKSNNSLNNGSDFTLNEGNADNTTEPESSILSSLTNLTSEPIIPPPQVYSSNTPSITTEGN